MGFDPLNMQENPSKLVSSERAVRMVQNSQNHRRRIIIIRKQTVTQ